MAKATLNITLVVNLANSVSITSHVPAASDCTTVRGGFANSKGLVGFHPPSNEHASAGHRGTRDCSAPRGNCRRPCEVSEIGRRHAPTLGYF